MRSSNFAWVLFFAVPVLGVIVLSIDRPFFKERFFIQAQPAFELLLALGFLTLWRSGRKFRTRFPLYVLRGAAAVLFTGLIGANFLALANYHLDPVYAKAPPWQLYRDFVSHEARPGDVMLTNFPEAAISYYSPAGLPFYVVPAERDRSAEFGSSRSHRVASLQCRERTAPARWCSRAWSGCSISTWSGGSATTS